MSKQAIVDRILSDAQAEAEEITLNAQEEAKSILSAAQARVDELTAQTQAEAAARSASIKEGRAASARLECAKISLKEKRRVIDAVYARAIERLYALPEDQCLALTSALLEQYAEEGDEVVFANNYVYVESAKALPVMAKKNLTVSQKRANIAGGMLLVGKISDKDLSYYALLAADREENQAAIAAQIFKGKD